MHYLTNSTLQCPCNAGKQVYVHFTGEETKSNSFPKEISYSLLQVKFDLEGDRRWNLRLR